MKARKAFSAFDFLRAFVNTLPMVYDTCLGQKKFTFKLPGKCALMMSIDSRCDGTNADILVSRMNRHRLLSLNLLCTNQAVC